MGERKRKDKVMHHAILRYTCSSVQRISLFWPRIQGIRIRASFILIQKNKKEKLQIASARAENQSPELDHWTSKVIISPALPCFLSLCLGLVNLNALLLSGPLPQLSTAFLILPCCAETLINSLPACLHVAYAQRHHKNFFFVILH